MDVFSHTLWGYGLFGNRGHPWLATLFGALPDLLSFGPLVAYRIITGTFRFGPPPHETIPAFTYIAYNITHSLLLALIVTGLVFCRRRDIGFAMLAWPFHICMDIPFHTREFFPTRFMWPVSDWIFDGISWASPWVWFPNLAGLILLLGYRLYARRMKRIRDSSAIIEKD